MKPLINTIDLRQQYPDIFTATWSGKYVYSGTDGAISGAVLTTATVLAGDLAGYTIGLKSQGYARVSSNSTSVPYTITMDDATSYDGETSVEWCVSPYENRLREAYDRMRHDIVYGCDAVLGAKGEVIAKAVAGMFDRTGQSDTENVDFLALIEDDDTRWNYAHAHLALHLIFRNWGAQGGEKMKENAWNHYEQYMSALNRALNLFADYYKGDYPVTERGHITRVQLVRT